MAHKQRKSHHTGFIQVARTTIDNNCRQAAQLRHARRNSAERRNRRTVHIDCNDRTGRRLIDVSAEIEIAFRKRTKLADVKFRRKCRPGETQTGATGRTWMIKPPKPKSSSTAPTVLLPKPRKARKFPLRNRS